MSVNPASAISAATRLCAVYGHPVVHSASPAMQNAGIAALGLDWRYLAFDVEPTALADAIRGAQAMRFIGLNLTLPHKLLAVEWVDELDESARTWGAVNTIRFEARDATGAWQPLARFDEPPATALRAHGFNTDADAITQSLNEDLGLDVAGARVLVLGTGGAGQTAALKLARDGVGHLYLVNRTVSKAEQLANAVRARHPEVTVHVGYPRGDVDLVLNATSLGLKPSDPLPFAPTEFAFSAARFAYDMIYRPAETPFLHAARSAGCRVANGLGMLLYQGARALELWTEQAAPVAVMRGALTEAIYGKALHA